MKSASSRIEIIIVNQIFGVNARFKPSVNEGIKASKELDLFL